MLTVQFFVTTAYGAVSFYLYTMIVYMMIKRWNEYNNTFFKIFIIEYVINIVTFLNSFITLRAPQNTCKECPFSFLFDQNSSPTEDNWPLQLFFTFHYSMAFIQYSITLMVALNRLSMVILVDSYEKYWRVALPIFMIVIIIYPFTVTWPIAASNAYFLYTPPMGTYATKSAGDVTAILNTLVNFMLTTTSLTAVANILAIIRLKCLPTRISGAEKNLFHVGLVSFVIQVLALGDTVRTSMANDHFPSLRNQVEDARSSGLA
ncbi:hypothetical protein CAEBREN_30978 [Caenorhabditis brenneri]|uniref:Serpentine receptor class gamma n=1 Tax=Caenorhabditis brenneri TaxID=135651 RepID=G0P9L3_CAEBE|nr:hypothetical protein CAEBREN_30978 [Caenorhabditis brenneri]